MCYLTTCDAVTPRSVEIVRADVNERFPAGSAPEKPPWATRN